MHAGEIRLIPGCDQRSMMRPRQPPNPPIPCRFAGMKKPLPPFKDNEPKYTIPNLITLAAAWHDLHVSPKISEEHF